MLGVELDTGEIDPGWNVDGITVPGAEPEAAPAIEEAPAVGVMAEDTAVSDDGEADGPAMEGIEYTGGPYTGDP